MFVSEQAKQKLGAVLEECFGRPGDVDHVDPFLDRLAERHEVWVGWFDKDGDVLIDCGVLWRPRMSEIAADALCGSAGAKDRRRAFLDRVAEDENLCVADELLHLPVERGGKALGELTGQDVAELAKREDQKARRLRAVGQLPPRGMCEGKEKP